MSKIDFKPGTMIYPLPAVMVTCGSNNEEHNIITVAWTGTICSEPPMCYISLRPDRHSYDIIKRNGEFVINLTTEKLARVTDWNGCRSGAKFDKWKKSGLTKGAAKVVNAPIIEESPVNIECKVKEIVKLGVHDMFISEVVNIRVDEAYMDGTGKFNLNDAKLLVYSHGAYHKTGAKIGKFGWSVEKKRK